MSKQSVEFPLPVKPSIDGLIFGFKIGDSFSSSSTQSAFERIVGLGFKAPPSEFHSAGGQLHLSLSSQRLGAGCEAALFFLFDSESKIQQIGMVVSLPLSSKSASDLDSLRAIKDFFLRELGDPLVYCDALGAWVDSNQYLDPINSGDPGFGAFWVNPAETSSQFTQQASDFDDYFSMTSIPAVGAAGASPCTAKLVLISDTKGNGVTPASGVGVLVFTR